MMSNAYFLDHQNRVQAQLDSVVDGHARVAVGDLVVGHKKDLVLTRKMQGRPDRVAIYGWHRLSGEPIQPVSTVHVDWYADYSHGVRLVWGTVLIDGEVQGLPKRSLIRRRRRSSATRAPCW
jgi:hypothetical protein